MSARRATSRITRDTHTAARSRDAATMAASLGERICTGEDSTSLNTWASVVMKRARSLGFADRYQASVKMRSATSSGLGGGRSGGASGIPATVALGREPEMNRYGQWSPPARDVMSFDAKASRQRLVADAPDELPPVEPYPMTLLRAIYLACLVICGVWVIGLYYAIQWLLSRGAS